MILFRRLTTLGVVAFLAALAVAGEHKKVEQQSATLQFVILRDGNDKPVRNAEIVLHPVDKHGHQMDEGLELKTHEDGKADVTGIPYGKWRVQVIAPGFRTYGDDYDVNQPNHEITIKLLKPAKQYSVYDK